MLKKEEVLKEELVLNDNLSLIKSKLDELKIDINSKQSELNVFRDYVWNDCKALRTSDDLNSRLEFDFLLEQQLKKEYIYNEKNILKRKLIKSYNSPYFGKIIFNNKDYYIGSAQINDDTDIRIYDWRAPISSIFYDYGLGSASYKFKDTIYRGNVTQKRQFVIENTKLKSVIENEQNIDDELLQDILSKESSDKMNSIINTIQSEQNQVIRNLSDNVLITEGVAGSGKTEIALHRIAYLLYHKKEYSSNNVLILSPNNIFSDYISNVLPSLNEENVLCTTFSYFAHKYINKETESYSNYLDRVYNSNIKLNEFDDNYKDLLDNYLNEYINSISFIKGVVINDIRFSKDDLNTLLNKYNKLCFIERINRISEYLIGACKIKRKYIRMVSNKLLTLLNKSIDAIDIYNGFLELNNKKTIKVVVNFEYLTPLLYITFCINDYPSDINIKHIVIDEAQDYSKFQLFLLKKIFVGSSFTILGDSNQNLNPFIHYKSLEEYKDVFSDGCYVKLDKAYRSVKSIMDYATNLIGIKVNCFRNKGNDVIIKESSNLKKDLINDIKSINNKRMAIITNNKEDCKYIYELLSDSVDVSSPLFDDNNSKIFVLPLYLAKGLEFDSVIVYNASKYSNNLLYVAATRAQNNLIIYK